MHDEFFGDHRAPLLYGGMTEDHRKVLTIDFDAMAPGMVISFERHDPSTQEDGLYLTFTITKPHEENDHA